MYDELVKRLRSVKDSWQTEEESWMLQAADAIEDLEFACDHYEKDYKALCDYLPKWIPVTERLPEDETYVLISFKKNMAVAYRRVGRWYVMCGGGWKTPIVHGEQEPTHWMPLPEPPMEET